MEEFWQERGFAAETASTTLLQSHRSHKLCGPVYVQFQGMQDQRTSPGLPRGQIVKGLFRSCRVDGLRCLPFPSLCL